MMKFNRIVFIIISLLIIFVLLGFLILKILSGKSGQNPTTNPPVSPSPNAQVITQQPVLITQNQQDQIKIEYFPSSQAIWVFIEAQSVNDYKDKRQKAVGTLKDSGIDPCDPKVFWAIPQNIKKDLTRDDVLNLHQITCPSRTPSPKPTPSANP